MLGDLGFPYYLGGSRRRAELSKDSDFIVSVTEKTDWDFYATWSEEREKILLREGFTLNSKAMEYRDSETVSIFEKGKIDFILLVNAVFYRRVFDNIYPEFYYKYIWKSSPFQPQRNDIVLCMEQLFSIRRLSCY